MKTNLLFIAFLFSSLFSIGQTTGDITIFSNTGEKFYVVLNGIRQNNMAETNVKVQGLTEEWYNCKIISASQKFEIEKNVAVKMDMQVTYRITEKKGKYKLKYYSEKAFDNTTEPNQEVVTYHSTESPQTTTTTKPISTTSTTTTTTTTGSNTNTNSSTTGTTRPTNGTSTTNTNVNTNTQGQGNTESVGMNVSINTNESTNGGTNESVNISINATGTGTQGNNGNGTGVNTNTSINESSTTTTTTSSTTSVNGQTTESYEESTTIKGGNGNTTSTTTTSTTTSKNMYDDDDMTVTMTSGSNNTCVMNETQFQNLKTTAKEKDFDDTKMSIVKVGLKDKCITAAQVKDLMKIFTFEEDKLELAKYAYNNCIDKENYQIVHSEFDFDSSTEELNDYILAK